MHPLLTCISIDLSICFGKHCIQGTRLWVSLLRDRIAEDENEADLLADYPQLSPDDIRAAIAHGAEMWREKVIPIAPRLWREVQAGLKPRPATCAEPERRRTRCFDHNDWGAIRGSPRSVPPKAVPWLPWIRISLKCCGSFRKSLPEWLCWHPSGE